MLFKNLKVTHLQCNTQIQCGANCSRASCPTKLSLNCIFFTHCLEQFILTATTYQAPWGHTLLRPFRVSLKMDRSTPRPAPCSLCPVPAGETPSRGHFVREDTAMGVHRVESLTHSEDPDTQESRPHPRPLPLHLPTSTEKSPLLTAEGTHRGSRAPATREGTHRGGTRSPAQKGTGLPGASTALT